MEIKLILTFIAGLIAAYVTFWNAERKIAIDNITKEPSGVIKLESLH